MNDKQSEAFLIEAQRDYDILIIAVDLLDSPYMKYRLKQMLTWCKDDIKRDCLEIPKRINE